MGHSQSPGVLVPESPASRLRQGTGLLVPSDDPSQLASAILHLLRNPGLATELGNNGRAFVAAEFSFQPMIEKTDQMYAELLRSRGVE